MEQQQCLQALLSLTDRSKKLIKTNLLVPETTPITQTKSWVAPYRYDRVIGVTPKIADGQTAFQLYIVEDIPQFICEAGAIASTLCR